MQVDADSAGLEFLEGSDIGLSDGLGLRFTSFAYVITGREAQIGSWEVHLLLSLFGKSNMEVKWIASQAYPWVETYV